MLFFYGNVVYDDVVGKERSDYKSHETRFCFVFYKAGRRFVVTGPTNTTATPSNGIIPKCDSWRSIVLTIRPLRSMLDGPALPGLTLLES